MMLPFLAQISIALGLLLLAVGSVSAGERAVDAAVAASMSPNMLALFAVAAGITMYRVVCPRHPGPDESDDEHLRPA